MRAGPAVVHLTPYAAPHTGSFIPMVEAAGRACVERGWHFEAVFGPGAEQHPWFERLSQEGLRTQAPPVRARGAATRWLPSLLRELPRPLVLHTHFTMWDVPAAVASIGRGDIHTVWHLHTRLDEGLAVTLRNQVRFGVLGRAVARLLCVGPEVLDKARARLAPPSRTMLFPNGVDVDHYSPVEAAERAEMRRELGVKDDRPILLLFAWDWGLKGGSLLIHSVPEVRRRGHDPVVVVVGSEREATHEARRLGLEDAVRIQRVVGDARLLMGAADLFVAPSVGEGLPFSVLEALSCGRAVVASDIPAHRFISQSVPGCELAARTPAAFGAAIVTALEEHPALAHSRGEASRAAVIAAFSLHRWSERLLQLYLQILDDPA